MRAREDILEPVGEGQEVHKSTVYTDLVCKHVLPQGTYTVTRIEVDGIPYLTYFCPWCDSRALLSFLGLKFYEQPQKS